MARYIGSILVVVSLVFFGCQSNEGGEAGSNSFFSRADSGAGDNGSSNSTCSAQLDILDIVRILSERRRLGKKSLAI